MRYQLFLPKEGSAGEWTTLKPKGVHEGREVRTKLFPDGTLFYIRRTGDVGCSKDHYTGGVARHWQWREHPADVEAAPPRFTKYEEPSEKLSVWQQIKDFFK